MNKASYKLLHNTYVKKYLYSMQPNLHFEMVC